MKCMTCKYATDKDKGALKCHRFPKAAIVSREYWCGEYQEEGPKKPLKNDKQK